MEPLGLVEFRRARSRRRWRTLVRFLGLVDRSGCGDHYWERRLVDRGEAFPNPRERLAERIGNSGLC